MIPEKLRNLNQWCVSKDKVPLDIYALKSGFEWGASDKRSHSSYVDYVEAVKIRAKTNYPITLRVDTETQGIYVIDIEKICPQEIRQAILLALHDSIIYLERSMSNKGYHLIIDTDPEPLPTAKYKKWFEILSKHHCTFTEREISFDTAYHEQFDENHFITDDDKDIELLNFLSKPVSPKDFYTFINPDNKTINITSSSLEEYKRAAGEFDGRHADLFSMLCAMDYQKTVDGDFNGDYSSYEFGYASKLHYLLQRLAADMIDADCKHYQIKLTREQAVMLVYMVLKQCLPPRDKHKSMRVGLPWLLYTSQQVYDKTFNKI